MRPRPPGVTASTAGTVGGPEAVGWAVMAVDEGGAVTGVVGGGMARRTREDGGCWAVGWVAAVGSVVKEGGWLASSRAACSVARTSIENG